MNNNYISLFLLGIYSGFLATIPIGPSKMLSVRNFLIRTQGSNNLFLKLDLAHHNFIAAITGVLVAQFYILLSIYFPALHSLWMKPHCFSIIFLPFLFYIWNKIKTFEIDTYSNDNLGSSNTYMFHIQTAFLETFLLQLLNPIVFPNSAFSRLPGVFLFRYSNIFTFIFGIVTGLLTGYIIFFILTVVLLKRLENDTPIIYRLVKRVIHQVFFPFFFIVCLISLGRTPIPSIKNLNKESWKEKTWPDMFFNYDTWTRPMRLLKNNKTNSNDENMRAFNKMYFSQDFFDIYKNNGKIQLFPHFPESLSIASKDFHNLLDSNLLDKEFEKNTFDEWIKNTQNRKIQILNNLSNRLLELNKERFLEEVLDKKLGSMNLNGIFFNKNYDPRLNTNITSKELEFSNKSPLLIPSQDFLEKLPFSQTETINLLNIRTNNRLKMFLSNKYEKIKDLPMLAWKPILKNNNIAITESDLYSVDINLFPEKDNWLVERFEKRNVNNIRSWNNILSNIQESLTINKETKVHISQLKENKTINLINNRNLLQFYKKIPLWNSKISKTDLQKPEPNEFRSILANFVRNLLPGAIRARRRKALAWNIYQNQAHSPLFLRAINSLKKIKHLTTNPENKFILTQNTTNEIQNNANILKTRWNFRIVHFVRGIALCSQAYIRRYIKIPIFIIIKNISRQVLFLPTEWQQDWKDLSQEIYVDCDYDGNDLYVGIKLPNISELTGKQVKILRPFPFKYSNNLINKNKQYKNFSETSTFSIENLYNYMLDNYSYLTIWGNETNEPFGKTKESSYLWTPIFKRLQLIINYKIINKIHKLSSIFNAINNYQDKFLIIVNKIQQFIPVVVNEKHEDRNIPKGNVTNKLIAKNISSIKKIEDIQINHKDPNLEKNIINQEYVAQIYNLDSHLLNKSTKHLEKLTALQRTKHQFSIKTGEKQNNKLENQLITEKEHSKYKQLDKTSILPNTFQVRKITLQHTYIYFQKNFFHLNRLVYKKLNDLYFKLKKHRRNINRFVFEKYTNIKHIVLKVTFYIKKHLYLLSGHASQLFQSIIFELNNFGISKKHESNVIPHEEISSRDQPLEAIYLSQASILHSMLQDNLINSNNIINLLKSWDNNKGIHKDLKRILLNTNNVNNFENLTYIDFKAFLSNSDGYTPSLKIWQKILPDHWSESVRRYWKENSPIVSSSNVLKPESLFQKQVSFNNLYYHTPLFDKAEKFHKISQLNGVLKKYTDFYQPNKMSVLSRDNNQKTFYIHNNTEQNLLKNRITKEKKIQHESVTKPDSRLLLSKSEIEEKRIQFRTIQNALIKKLPHIDKEIKRITSSIDINSLKNRITYPPTRENKWKLAGLQNRFRNLMRVAKQRNVLKESLLDKKHAIEIPYQIRKDLDMFYKTFEPEDILFVNLLENWRYKIIDDELLMYHMISSYLKFLIKQEKNSLVDIKNISKYNSFDHVPVAQYDLLPEKLLLQKNVRELRILEKLNFNASINEYEKLSMKHFIYKNTQLPIDFNKTYYDMLCTKDNKDYNKITSMMRFIWPTHRLEDLAYINRFWVATSNQSRFSLLRIRTSPIY